MVGSPIEYLETVYCQNNASCKSWSGTVKVPETPTTPLGKVFMYWNDMPAEFVLPAGQSRRTWTFLLAVDKDTAVAAKADFDAAIELVGEAAAAEMATPGGSNPLYDNQSKAFEEVWKRGDIEVDGDLYLQKVIRGCLYYIYTSLPSHETNSAPNSFYGLSPGGLPNGALAKDYQGHVFWDMETWMYPPILMLRPDLARDMLSYRINGMPEAFARALEGGYGGARFPWESAQTGIEVTPDVCVPCRENQQHITGDIAFAARQYVAATRDIDWLNVTAGTQLTAAGVSNYSGYDFILEMARFWYTRPTFNMTKDRYEIKGVMPPDEHAEDVDNSVYTNIVASYAIHFARYAACLAGRQYLEQVPDRWLHVAQRLKFTFNDIKRYHEEFEGYDHQVETNTTDVRGVKQADVVMLGYPLLWSMPDDVRRNDLTFYEAVTNPDGPAMTWGVFSTGWLDLGDYARADALFDKAYRSYVREPFKIWTEVQSGDGAINFVTGMGGFLQTVLFGYGGLRLNVEQLDFRQARLPPNTTRVAFRNVDYLGSQFDVVHDSAGMTTVNVTSVGLTELQLRLTSPAENYDITAGFVKTFPVQQFSIGSKLPTGCPPMNNPAIDVDYSSPTTTISPPPPTVSAATTAGLVMRTTSIILASLLSASWRLVR
jgi:trehalose/maltose hydrolase-like predicted phosphorylase